MKCKYGYKVARVPRVSDAQLRGFGSSGLGLLLRKTKELRKVYPSGMYLQEEREAHNEATGDGIVSLVKSVERLEPPLEPGTVEHLLARLLGLVDESSSWWVDMKRRGGGQLVEAAQQRLALSGFVDDVMGKPMETWRESFEGAPEHHGPLLVIVLGNLGLRRLPSRPVEALELAQVARSCDGTSGVDGPDPLDVEIQLLVTAVETVAVRLMEEEPQAAHDRCEKIIRELDQIRASTHPELMADAWWLCGIYWRLSGKLGLAEAAQEEAIAWAEDIQDGLRIAEFQLERGLVLELAGRLEEACAADARALEELRGYPGEVSLRARGVLQRATHLIDRGHFKRAERLVDEWARVLHTRWETSVTRLRGRIALGAQLVFEAEIFLEAAREMAEADEDPVEQGLVGVERMALLDDLGEWGRRREAVQSLRRAMMACPEAPGLIVTALTELEKVEDEEPLDPTVIGCLRRRFREWQARQCQDVGVRVM